MRKLMIFLSTLFFTVLGAKAQTWMGNTPQAGDFYLYNVGAGKFLTSGCWWGTHAALDDDGLLLTLAGSGNDYTLSTDAAYAGKYLGDNAYMDNGTAATWTFTQVSTGKYTLKNGSNYLVFVSGAIANTSETAPTTNAGYWQLVSRDDLIENMKSATPSSPVDASFFMTNPKLRRQWRNGTPYEGPGFNDNGSFNANADGLYTGGCTSVGQWHKTFDNYQSLTNLPNGQYQVTVKGFNRYDGDGANSPAYMYANSESIILPEKGDIGTDNAEYATRALVDDTYLTGPVTVTVTDGSLRIGVKSEATCGWVTWREFTVKMLDPCLSFVAEALPANGDMVADKWYYFDIAVAGSDYNATATTLGDIVYTTDGTILYSNESDVSAHLSATNNNLSAARYYVKSSSANNLSVAAAAYSYSVGTATTDKSYVQPGQTVTVTWANAATNDTGATFAKNGSPTITLAGSTLSFTTTSNGFTFTVPSLAAGGSYTLAIPANAFGYSAGSTYNTAQDITIYTTSVYDGTYFLKNEAGQYLSRGADWGTRAIVDDWGLPIVVETDNDNNSTLKYSDTGVYLYNSGYDAWSDGTNPANNNTKWTFTLNDSKYRLSSLEQSGKYVKTDSGSEKIWTDGAAAAATNWTVEATADHPAQMAALRTAATSLSGSVGRLSSKTYLTNNPTSVTEQYERAIGENPAPDAFSGSIKVYPGIYKFTIAAFHRMGTNAATQALHTEGADCPPMYAFFGDAKVQLKSVYDEYPTGNVGTDNQYNGHYYPNGVGGALTSFQEGKFQNTIWVEVDAEATNNYGIHYQGKSTAAGRWTIWAPDGIEITRYYDKATQGLDEADQLIESLRYIAGDFNESGAPDATDIQTLVDILLGRNTTYNEAIADVDGNGDGTTLADLTKLVNVALGKEEARVVDETYTYANINATVYAEQSASENASGANYTIDSAVCSLTNEAVANPSSKYDMTNYLTTLNIATSLSNVVSVSVYAKGKENIAGLMAYNTQTGPVSYSAGTTPSVYVNGDRDDVNGKNMQSDVVTVAGSNAGTYTAYLLPVTLSNGVTVTVRTSDGKYYSQDFTPTVGAVNDLTFTETTATNNWMATIPGNVNFSMLSTPGAHNAATGNVSSSQAKCQSETIQGLLDNGVRAFDLRPQYCSNSTITADNLTIYHGSVSTGILYKDVISTMAAFLDAHPTEAISIIMMKESASGSDQTSTMVSVINSIHSNYSSYFKVLDHSYYTLDDFRGKIFYGCRPAQDITGAVRVTNWPDDTSVTNYGVGVGGLCTASVEDAYNSTDNTKKSAVNALLDLASTNTDRSRFHYTFTSVAWSLLGASITGQANTQNPAAATYISGTLTGPTGYVYGDFMGSSSYSGATLLKAIIDQNYKYVFKGRTRVQ